MEIYVKMNEEELEEFKEYKKTKEIKTCFNDDNVIDYIIKRYREITNLDLRQYYNYKKNLTYSDRDNPFYLKSEDKSVHIDDISVKICDWS